MSTQTTSVEKDSRENSDNDTNRLVEAVSEDSFLNPGEKETILRFCKSDDRVSVYTEENGLMRRLLQHPEFDVDRLRVTTEDEWGKSIDADDFDGGSITGVEGWVPIQVLSLTTSPRTTPQHATIVSERVLRGE